MNWFTAILTYLTIWWLVLFCVLPFGARSQAEAGKVIEGTDPGAPVVANIRQKFMWTSVIAAIVWGILALLITTGAVSLEHPLGKLVN